MNNFTTVHWGLFAMLCDVLFIFFNFLSRGPSPRLVWLRDQHDLQLIDLEHLKFLLGMSQPSQAIFSRAVLSR